MSDLLVVENLPTREVVYRKLRDAILAGRFQPGERLPERELVELMGVSRTPIREALRRLERDGLVTTVAYKGPAVTLPTPQDARDLYEARAALEGQAVALFVERADPAAVDRLHACVESADRAAAAGRVQEVLEANNAFHDELAHGCGNAILQSMIANLRDRIILLRVESLSHPGRPRKSIAEHRAIIRTIAKRDALAAKGLTEDHIMQAWRAAAAQLARGRSG